MTTTTTATTTTITATRRTARWSAPLLTLCLALVGVGLSGCKSPCNTEGFEAVWDELAGDFGDASVMGGKPMGCHAGYPGGDTCPEGAVCNQQLMSFFADVSIDDAEKNATAMLEKHGYKADPGSREKKETGPVSVFFLRGDGRLELAVGRVGDSAEVLLVRDNQERP